MRPIFLAAAFLLAALAMPACAQEALMRQTHPYVLTAADADAINARRPTDWNPYRVTAGDVFAIDGYGLIHIPTTAPASGGDLVFIEDLEPQASR